MATDHEATFAVPTMLACPRDEAHGPHDQAASYCWRCGKLLVSVPAKCSGYCVGTSDAEKLVEDLACPLHGIKAQDIAQEIFPDRQAWLDALAEAS